MSKYYEIDVNWKKIIGEGAKYGGLTGAAAGVINALFSIIMEYNQGKLSSVEVL